MSRAPEVPSRGRLEVLPTDSIQSPEPEVPSVASKFHLPKSQWAGPSGRVPNGAAGPRYIKRRGRQRSEASNELVPGR